MRKVRCGAILLAGGGAVKSPQGFERRRKRTLSEGQIFKKFLRKLRKNDSYPVTTEIFDLEVTQEEQNACDSD